MDEVRDGYYCLLIALLKGCTVEKAIAMYENRQMWITPEFIEEMAVMRKTHTLKEMSEIYGMQKPQIIEYLRKGEKNGSKTDNDGKGDGESG